MTSIIRDILKDTNRLRVRDCKAPQVLMKGKPKIKSHSTTLSCMLSASIPRATIIVGTVENIMIRTLGHAIVH